MEQSPLASELWKQNILKPVGAIEGKDKMQTSEAVVRFPELASF
jgi:hypothetical protein